jgi:hypothetical protein
VAEMTAVEKTTDSASGLLITQCIYEVNPLSSTKYFLQQGRTVNNCYQTYKTFLKKARKYTVTKTLIVFNRKKHQDFNKDVQSTQRQ